MRLAELTAVLSKATDLGMGQPLETALSTCVVATRLGIAAGLPADELQDVYYLALLRYIGCNAETHVLAALFGDELALRREFAEIDTGDPRQVGALAGRLARHAGALSGLPALMHESFSGHCEVAQRLAERMSLPASLIDCLGQLYERWDGRGQPRGLRAEEVSRPVLVVTLAQDAVIRSRMGGGAAGAVALARERAGAAYAPRLAECFADAAAELLADLDEEPAWQTVLDLEPGRRKLLSAEELERGCEAIADFVDLKSPYTLGHSPGVAALAAGAALGAGMLASDVTGLRQAALLHDVGRAGVSAAIWGKPGPLSEREWERVRLHPYFTERVLAGAEPLEGLGRLASQHHERMNGSGYHRGVGGAAISPPARILAAADAYHAATETRPHRPARSDAEAADELRTEVRAGRLDGDAVQAVLAAAGHRVSRARQERPAGLSRREVEVLRLLARGHSNREIGTQLYVAPDTVKRHIQHIYDKTGLSTRAGATLFAVENALI